MGKITYFFTANLLKTDFHVTARYVHIKLFFLPLNFNTNFVNNTKGKDNSYVQ